VLDSARQSGLTLIEMMVVLLVILLVTVAMVVGYGRLPATALKHEAVRVAATLRAGYDGAAASGAYHRMVIDIDEGTFKVERCEGKVQVKRAHDVKEEMDRMKDEAEKAARLAEESQSQIVSQSPGQQPVSLESLLTGVASPPGGAVGGSGGEATARCVPMRGELGKGQRLGEHPKVSFSRVWVAHLEEPAAHGKVFIHFFPLGTAEKAVIELGTDADNKFSIALQPISGRIDMMQGQMRRPEDFLATDAQGNRIQ